MLASKIFPAAWVADQAVSFLTPVFQDHPKNPRQYYGVGKAGASNRRGIAKALDDKAAKEGYKIDPRDFGDEALEKVADKLAKEVATEVKLGTNATGWYGPKYANALKILSARFPELTRDPAAKGIFTAILAVTSNGQNPRTNLKLAIKAYTAFQETGTIPSNIGVGERSAAINKNLEQLDQYLKQAPSPGAAVETLLTEDTVANLKKYARDLGMPFDSGYLAADTVPTAAVVMGEKVGAFFSNLMGSEGHLTMDRWWSRTINRYRGNLVPKMRPTQLPRFKELLGTPDMSDEDAIKASIPLRAEANRKGYKKMTPEEQMGNIVWKSAFETINDSPVSAGERSFMMRAAKLAQKKLARRGIDLSIADVQAIIWYYEKNLYDQLSARTSGNSKKESYEDVAPHFVLPGSEDSSVDSTPPAAEDEDEEPELRLDETTGKAV